MVLSIFWIFRIRPLYFAILVQDIQMKHCPHTLMSSWLEPGTEAVGNTKLIANIETTSSITVNFSEMNMNNINDATAIVCGG